MERETGELTEVYGYRTSERVLSKNENGAQARIFDATAKSMESVLRSRTSRFDPHDEKARVVGYSGEASGGNANTKSALPPRGRCFSGVSK